MTEIWQTLASVRSALADDLDELAQRQSAAVLEKTEGAPEPVAQAELDVAAERCRSDCLDELLTERFADKTAQAAGVDDPDLQVLAFDFRQSAVALRIDPAEPQLEVRASFLMIAAGLGALAGMAMGAWLCVLLQVQAEGIETGRLAGGLLGPAVAVALGIYITHRDRLRKVIQWMLGITAVGVGVSEVLGWFSPTRRLWRAVTGRSGGAGFWGKLKLIFVCVGLVVLLQLAKPIKRANREQLRRNVRSAIRSWLGIHLDLMTLLLIMQKARSDASAQAPASPISSVPILQVVQKLSLATSDEERSAIAEEMLQECENAGIVLGMRGGDGVFTETLRDAYNVVGLINPGDPYRELDPPIREGERVVVKGRITRKRDT